MESNLHVYKNMIQNISSLISDESRKDVTFIFPDSEIKITAHKLILEAVSPVFKTMFSGKFAETNEVAIEDIRPEVFQLLINGIYLQKINHQTIDPSTFFNKNYAELYYAAEKYDLEDIREISKKFILDDCCLANIHWWLHQAKLFNLQVVEAKCMMLFEESTYDALRFHMCQEDLDDEIFSNLFDLEHLSIAKEYELYVALEVMVDNNRLKSYSKCLSKIRFLTMEIKEIFLCKLLSSDDKLAIISNIEAQKRKEVPEISMPTHLSTEINLRIPTIEEFEDDRKNFLTAIMLSFPVYEQYWKSFLGLIKISEDQTFRTYT